MRSHTEYLTFRTKRRREPVRLTPMLETPSFDGQRDKRVIVKVIGQ